MTMELQNGHKTFEKQLWHMYGRKTNVESLKKIQDKAWARFLELGLPSRKDEVYRYFPLRSFYTKNYEPGFSKKLDVKEIEKYIIPECKNSVLVFVNGCFTPSLSCFDGIQKRVVILPLNEAMSTYGGFLNGQLLRSTKDEIDAFAILNLALIDNGLFLYLPPKTIIDRPIQILNIVKTEDVSAMVLPRVQVFVGMQSQLSLTTSQATLSARDFAVNMVVDIAVEEDSHVTYTQIPDLENDKMWLFDALRSNLKSNSSLKTILLTEGSASTRHDYRIGLIGDNAEVFLNGLWMLKNKREAHTHVLVEHQAPGCRSLQLFKGVLDDVSRSSFEGKILVRREAQKTEAFQLNNNLLLSEHAIAYSKPNLEIFADDVKASHGATVGQLDSEQIFYMQTRGFSEIVAKNLLVKGFCKEVINLISIHSLFNQLQNRADKYLLD